MPEINILSTNLINKIAAGEVVERPASVVKELLENSLDAGSSSISLEIEDGGKKLIRISDDGSGMDQADLALAIHPHATSKLSCEEDLYHIMTMGFRGEALASIASISQMEIISRTRDNHEGYRLEVNGGEMGETVPVAASPGTTITIRNLFFNTPARRKFLRTTNTEMSHITEDMGRIALAHCDIQFTLKHNARTIFDFPAGQSLRDRLRLLFSAELANDLLSIERNDRGVHIHGLIAPPAQSKNAAKWQYIFLNGRAIRDKFISHAMKEAYRGLIEPSRYPVAFLFIDIDPGQVDVNVHPTKMEVRFAESNLIHSQVLAAMRDKLLSTDLTRVVRSDEIGPDHQTDNSNNNQLDDPTQKRREDIRAAMADFFKNRPPQAPSSASPQTSSYNAAAGLSQHHLTSQQSDKLSKGIDPLIDSSNSNLSEQPADSTIESSIEHHNDLPINYNTIEEIPSNPSSCNGPCSFVQVHNSYIVQQSNDGLVIVDQHALHERILYEKLNRQLAQGKLASQRLLLPEIIEVTPAQMAAAENNEMILNELGITAEPFGPRSLAIQSFPVLLEKLDMRTFVLDLLDLLTERAGHVSREEMTHVIIDMMACKAAIKAGDPLSSDEIRELMAKRQDVERISNCPHGRPTTVRLTLRELEKLFKRT